MNGPMSDIKVIELGQLLAGPYCGQLFADYGATVIKLEQPEVGDPLRKWGRERVDGETLWWPIAARNKRSVTCNLRDERGQDIVRRLVADADVLLENFRPGTMERWGLGWEELSAINPKLVMVRVSGFGQTGPYAKRPGYASIGEAMGGLRYVMGDPSSAPSRAGISIGDSLAAIYATLGAMAALHHVNITGRGQVVDASIYESVLAVMESLVPEYTVGGFTRERTGPMLPNVAPSNLYPTIDGEWVLIAANQDTLFRRLCNAMGKPEWITDDRFVDHLARGAHQAELDGLIAEWTATMTADEVLELMVEHEVAAGGVYRAPDMLADPHFQDRESIVEVDHPRLGTFAMQNVFPKFSETPAAVEWVGPELGEHNDEVLKGTLGFDDETLAQFRADGVI
ncbi:CaiB/BaiF CoA transferase family protein [Ilumatobacter coccineus]|jgi:succinyl-CoA---D-citramalate CoA-transferase|uniref:Putative CoA-transferase n=1 Tax=Ilumatobacter coccineus (strain NBRC 103263 / KCTC 29153 / YM16-304) TaxID=1313172 RepID=A0A6C7EE94_ILUCY|nr:putative CoA-transferase [Ilumatobacter coccineus YM16-304]